MEHKLSMGDLLAEGSDASVSEEPPHELAAEAKGRAARPASPAAPPRRRGSPAPAKVERVWDTSGEPCRVCGKPGHMGGHCPNRGAERLENDRRVLQARAAAAAARAAEAPPTAAKQESLPAGEKDKKGSEPLAAGDAPRSERERPRSRDGDRGGRKHEAPRSRSRDRPRSRDQKRSRSRDRDGAGSRGRERSRDKQAAAKKHRSRERSGSRERKDKRRRSRSRSRSRGRAAAEPRSRSRGRAAAEPRSAAQPVEENKYAFKDTRVPLETVLAEAKRLKRAADAVTTHDAPKEMLRAVLQYVEAAMMQQSQIRGSISDAAAEALAVLLTQTSALCNFAAVRADELLAGAKANEKTTAELNLVRLLALRLCVCCIAQAASFRRAGLRAEAEAAASASEGSIAVQKRMAGAVLEAIKLSDLWERSGEASIAATQQSTVNRNCTDALTACLAVAGTAGGFGDLRQVRFQAKHALGKIDTLWAR